MDGRGNGNKTASYLFTGLNLLCEIMNLNQDAIQLTKYLAQLKLPVWLFDVNALGFVWANDLALELWSADSVSELCERDASEGMSTRVHERLCQYVDDANADTPAMVERWTFYPKGDPVSYECMLSGLDVGADRPLLLVIAVQKGVESDLDTLYRANALVHTSVFVSVFGSTGDLVYSNPAARSMLGPEQKSLQAHFNDDEDYNAALKAIEMYGRATMEVPVNTDNGVVAWHSLSLERCPDPLTGDAAILVSEIDVTERRDAQDKILKLAYSDTLTGLHNRTYFLNDLTNKVAECRKNEEKVAIFFIDLDRFKLINDSLGHAVGDSLLVAVANRLRRTVGENDVVARLGGDEFTVMISNFDDDSEVLKKADNIVQEMATPLKVRDYELLVTPSIGVCIYPDHGQDVSELMQHADLAMYDAKADGGGRCVYRKSLNTNVQERLRIESELRKGLKQDQLELYYQPKLDCRSGQITGVEALIRWNHPTRGMVMPFEFIGIAEECGLVGDITHFVLNEAMRQQRRWADKGIDLSMAVNISPRDFKSGSLISVLATALEQSGCEPSKIELEITESMLMAGNTEVIATLNSVKNLGLKLSIDDFGTGYSNLAYLQQFPLDSLKIDRSFLSNTDYRAVLEMIIHMGKMLSLTIVAEGVETEEQLHWLRSMETDEVQGYLFSKPINKESVVDLVSNYDSHQYFTSKKAA